MGGNFGGHEITEKDVNEKINAIQELTNHLCNELLRKSKSNDLTRHYKLLVQAEKFLQWTLQKFKLRSSSSPQYVFQRDIFFCDLGINVGDEINHKRPVVVLQNNAGNRSAKSTIVAPITTCEGSNLKYVAETDTYYFEWQDADGQMRQRGLYYFEIPVQLEPEKKRGIIGVINLAQVRTISKLRLDKQHVARITEETKRSIELALPRLLAFSSSDKGTTRLEKTNLMLSE